MVESETVTFEEDTMSMPSEFTPRSRSEKTWMPRTHDPVAVLQADVPERRVPDGHPFDAHVLRLLEDDEVLLHVAGAVVPLHLHAGPPRDLLLLGDLHVHALDRLVGPLRIAVEQAAAGDGDVPRAAGVHEREHARRPVRAVAG